jgi:ABC-type multidrug transport system fused ATPase/permease subunit
MVSSIGERVTEIFGGLKFIRSSGLAEDARIRSEAMYRTWADGFYAGQMYSLGSRQVFELLGLMFIAAFLAFSLTAAKGSLASNLVFLAIFYRLAPKLLQVQDSFFQALTYHSWVQTWNIRLRLAGEAKPGHAAGRAPSFKHQIEFQAVSFRYQDSERLAVADIQLSVQRNETVAIVGPSGSGKSTLLDLLTGLLQPTSGQVLVDDARMSDLDSEAWRRTLGLVMQETPLLHASVLENIAWGDAPPKRDKAVRCARMASATSFIDQLPGGLDASVGERGSRLSGGQRQRIAIARALYRDPSLLILDEPTSALDVESEREVHRALEQLKGHCAMVLVTHRLATAQLADRIIILDDGRILERGTWSELMAKPKSQLRKLVELQKLT